MFEIINTLEQIDTQIFLFFNGMHNAFWDYFMMLYSSRFVWIPFYVSFLFVMCKNYSTKSVITCLLSIIAIIVLCDQTASSLLKPMVERMRPSNLDNPIAPLVHIVGNYRGGSYGFPSSHAANAWGMVFFASFVTKNKKLIGFLAIWGTLMAYSRIYLGVHYPGDLAVGLLIGCLYSLALYYAIHLVDKQLFSTWQDKDYHIRYAQLPFMVGILSVFVMLIAAAILAYMQADVFIK